jgi:putative redox protein
MTASPSSLSLDWRGGLSFESSDVSSPIRLASDVDGMNSPMQALAYAVMGCMAIDVVHILEKGRCNLQALTVRFDGERAESPPRRYVTMQLHFDLTGELHERVVERAIELSREKYCSVWHTLKEDIDLTTSFAIHAVA